MHATGEESQDSKVGKDGTHGSCGCTADHWRTSPLGRTSVVLFDLCISTLLRGVLHSRCIRMSCNSSLVCLDRSSPTIAQVLRVVQHLVITSVWSNPPGLGASSLPQTPTPHANGTARTTDPRSHKSDDISCGLWTYDADYEALTNRGCILKIMSRPCR